MWSHHQWPSCIPQPRAYTNAVKAAEQHAGDEEVLWKSKCNFPFPKVPPIPHQYRDSISNVLQEKECTIEIYWAPFWLPFWLPMIIKVQVLQDAARSNHVTSSSSKIPQKWYSNERFRLPLPTQGANNRSVAPKCCKYKYKEDILATKYCTQLYNQEKSGKQLWSAPLCISTARNAICEGGVLTLQITLWRLFLRFWWVFRVWTREAHVPSWFHLWYWIMTPIFLFKEDGRNLSASQTGPNTQANTWWQVATQYDPLKSIGKGYKIQWTLVGQVQYSFCFAMAFCATRYPNIAGGLEDFGGCALGELWESYQQQHLLFWGHESWRFGCGRPSGAAGIAESSSMENMRAFRHCANGISHWWMAHAWLRTCGLICLERCVDSNFNHWILFIHLMLPGDYLLRAFAEAYIYNLI